MIRYFVNKEDDGYFIRDCKILHEINGSRNVCVVHNGKYEYICVDFLKRSPDGAKKARIRFFKDSIKKYKREILANKKVIKEYTARIKEVEKLKYRE